MNQEIDLASVTCGLLPGDDGIWRGSSAGPVSYPEDGSASAFAFEDASFWFAHRNRIIIDAIHRVVPPPRPFLDIGGGNGFVTRAMMRAGYPSVMLEPSETGVANARLRGVEQVICSDFRGSLFRPGQIEVAGLFDVLEHIEDDVGFLRDVASILRPDGLVAITVPAFQTLFSSHDTAAGHYRRYTCTTVTALLRAGGFEPLHAGYFMAMVLPPVFLFRTLPGWFGWQRDLDPARDQREHGVGSPLRHLARAALAAEYGILRRGWSMPFGASCIALGRLTTRPVPQGSHAGGPARLS